MSTVVDSAYEDCRLHLHWAMQHLRAVEEETTQIWRVRKAMSNGFILSPSHQKRAEEMLAEAKYNLDCCRIALFRLAEGVDTHTSVK